METATLTITQFIFKHNLKFECHWVESRPDGLPIEDNPLENYNKGKRHFRCRIIRPESLRELNQSGARTVEPSRSFSLYFSQGSDPTLADVLDCLAMDVAGYENSINVHPNSDEDGFPAWAAEYGYDIDSRKAEKIYRTVKRQAEQLKRTLGAEAYEELLWQTERL